MGLRSEFVPVQSLQELTVKTMAEEGIDVPHLLLRIGSLRLHISFIVGIACPRRHRRVPKALDVVQLLKALEAVLPAGRRYGSHIVASNSVRVGIAQASKATIIMHPVPSCLFETPRADARGRFEVLTLKSSR